MLQVRGYENRYIEHSSSSISDTYLACTSDSYTSSRKWPSLLPQSILAPTLALASDTDLASLAHLCIFIRSIWWPGRRNRVNWWQWHWIPALHLPTGYFPLCIDTVLPQLCISGFTWISCGFTRIGIRKFSRFFSLHFTNVGSFLFQFHDSKSSDYQS